MKMNQDERRFDFHGLVLAIKQAREERGWTQAYLAELVEKTDRTIPLLADGQKPVRYEIGAQTVRSSPGWKSVWENRRLSVVENQYI